MKSRNVLLFGSSLVIIGLGPPAITMAQETALEEVIVTAQKRQERLIDVPVSIAAISGEELQERGLSSIQDIAFAVPGMATREDGPGSYTIFMRGLSNQYGTGALVGMYLDEAPLSLTGFDQLDSRVMDLDRLEVLKGPQGTLYGQGSVAGVVRYVTKDPVLDALQGRLEASVAAVEGGSGKQSLTGIVNFPLVNNVLAVRLAGTVENGGGWQDQPQAGILNGNYQDLKNLRGKLLWSVTDGLVVKAMAVVHRNRSKLGLGYENPDHTVFVAIDPSKPLIPKSFDYNLYNLDVTQDFAAAQLISSSTYIHLEHHYPFSYIGGPETIYGGLLGGNDTRHVAGKQFSEELRLASRGQTPLKWTIGAFYRSLKRDFDDIYDTLYAGVVYPNATYVQNDKYNSYSLFGDASYDITHRFTLGAGARYFRDNQSTFDGASVAWDRFHSTDPRVYASYKVSDAMNVYGSVAKGFRSGGFNHGNLPTYGPESLISYELGTKGLIAGGALSFEAAAYYSDYSDMLRRGLLFVASTASFQSLTSNIGTVHIKGLEGGLTWRATRQLTLNTTASWIRSEVVSVNATDATNITGDSVDYVPKFAGTVSGNYALHWTDRLPGYVRVDYSYRDKVDYTDRTSFPAGNVPQTSDAIGLLDARLGVSWGKGNVELFGSNLTNENRWIDPYHAWANANRTRPRMLGARVGYEFD